MTSIIPFAGSGLGYQVQDHKGTNMLKKLLYTAVAVTIGMTYFVVAYIIYH